MSIWDITWDDILRMYSPHSGVQKMTERDIEVACFAIIKIVENSRIEDMYIKSLGEQI